MCASWATRYFICISGYRPPSSISFLPRHTAVFRLVQLVVLPDLVIIGIAVEILLISCVQADIYVISYLLPVTRPPSLIFTHLTSYCTNIRPTMLFDANDMRIPLKFHKYSISNVRFKCFRFPVRHFDFRLNSHRIVHRVMLVSAAVTSASSKTNAATFNLLPQVIS